MRRVVQLLADREAFCFPLWHRGQEDGLHFVLFRRFLDKPRTTFALVFAPVPTSLARLVEVAGSRWRIEEDFENSKHPGMDHICSSYSGSSAILAMMH